MNTHLRAPVLSYQKGLCLEVGRFFPNGSSAVDNSLNEGKGFTVTHDGTGVFGVEFDSSWPQTFMVHAELERAAAADQLVINTTYDPATRKATITVWDISSAAAADIAAAAASSVVFFVICSRSSGT